jgi:hypothetical protein
VPTELGPEWNPQLPPTGSHDLGPVAGHGSRDGVRGRTLPNLDGDKLAWRIGILEALRMAVGLVSQVDRGSLEPTDHGLDLNTDVLGKLPRAEVGLLELQDELIDCGEPGCFVGPGSRWFVGI